MKTFSLSFLATWIFTIFLLQNSNAQTLLWLNSVDSTQQFSSPHAIDLNNDNVKDIIIGGGYDLFPREQAISAYDGANGQVLWQRDSRAQFFGSAIFNDLNNDGSNDVLIGGRTAQLEAINGLTGDTIWKFFPDNNANPNDFGWYNFYNPQWIPDQNNDNIQDILISNGGNHLAEPFDTINRPVGRLVVISGANGQVISYAEVPDGRETYCSPLIHDFEGNGTLSVIYGTGGEIIRGGLWRTTLDDILAGDISNSVQLLYSNPEGFIAPPTLADITTDGIMDILVTGYNGVSYAIDGHSNQIIWSLEVPGTETNCSPTVGQFTDDFIPDFFTSVHLGTAPSFIKSYQMLIDGETGQLLWIDSLGTLNFPTALAVDLDGDNKDEVILSVNYMGANPTNQILQINFADNPSAPTITPLTDMAEGINLAATPYIGDLDNNGLLDLVYIHNTPGNQFSLTTGYVIKRIELPNATPNKIAYGAYMGTNYTGKYENPYCSDFNVSISTINSPCYTSANGSINLQISGGQVPYIITRNGVESPPIFSSTIGFQNLSPNTYPILITDAEGCKLIRQAIVSSPPEISINAITYPENPEGIGNGSVDISVSGGAAPYLYSLNGGQFSDNNVFGGLYNGNYTIDITDSNNCTASSTFYLGTVGIAPINNNTNNSALYISPNPAKEQLHIQVKNNPTHIIKEIRLYNVYGQLVNTIFPSVADLNGLYIDVSSYSAGVYWVESVAGNVLQKARFVKF